MASNLVQCPLNPYVMLQLETRMNLFRVQEIQEHVLAGTCTHPPLKDLRLHGTTDGPLDGSTPLLLACAEGHLDSVIRIVEDWRADVQEVATYYNLDGKKIGLVAPLFVAALKGRTDIVRYLILKQADVSARTSTQGNRKYDGLTPLHGALMESRAGQSFSDKCLESSTIVWLLLDAGADPSDLAPDKVPLWMRDYCGAYSTIALVNHGLDLNQRNTSGETILHHWIQFNSSIDCSTRCITEEEREYVVNLLIDKGADLMAQDSKGFSPILTSAVLERFNILDKLLESKRIDRSNKIDALELAGAQLLLDDPEKANYYWTKAWFLRQTGEPIIKVPLQVTTQSVVEWVDLEDLQTVMENPSLHWIQSMLTRLRIYSYRPCKAVQEFVDYEFSAYGFVGDYDGYLAYYNKLENPPTETQIEDLMMVVLGVFIRLEDPYGTMLWDLTQNLVNELTESFITIHDGPLDTLSKVLRIKTSLQLILVADPDSRIKLKYGFFAMLAKLPDVLLNKDIRNYLSQSARKDDGILLPKACEKEDWKTLRLLLHLGTNPNRADRYGNLPLHLVANRKEHPMVLEGKLEREQISLETEYTAAHLLFDYGANPYAINKEGKTAVDLWMEKNCGGKGVQSSAWKNRPYWCRESVPKLVCLIAKFIHTHGMSFSRDPKDLTVTTKNILNDH